MKGFRNRCGVNVLGSSQYLNVAVGKKKVCCSDLLMETKRRACVVRVAKDDEKQRAHKKKYIKKNRRKEGRRARFRWFGFSEMTLLGAPVEVVDRDENVRPAQELHFLGNAHRRHRVFFDGAPKVARRAHNTG